MGQKVTIILPTLNEEETIARVIQEIPGGALRQKGYQVEILVVDGDSADRTREIALENGARVIIEPRKGKGRAMRTALEQIKADFIFMLDADYTYPASYIPDMLVILQHDYPVVIGSRLRGQREENAMSRLNTMGNHLLTLMASILYLTRISDLCTGYWGFRSEVISHLHLTADGFNFEAELFTEVVKNGYSIAELPIYYRHRPTPAKLSSIKDGLKIGWTLVTRRF